MNDKTISTLISITDIEKMAGAIAKSGLFGIKTPDQAMALMLIAQAEGLHPAIAARDYHVIQGRPSLKADAMLARFQTAGGKVRWTEYTESRVAGLFSHPQGGEVEVSWTIDQAKKLGFLSKDNWKNYPRAMLRARCISEGIRTVFPGVVVGVYTPEEVEDMEPAKTKDMGAAEVVHGDPVKTELPAYPPDQFAKNLPVWMKLIADGTKPAVDVIATVSSKYTLSPEQRKAILAAAKPAAPATDPTTEIPAKSKEVQDWQDEYARGEQS